METQADSTGMISRKAKHKQARKRQVRRNTLFVLILVALLVFIVAKTNFFYIERHILAEDLYTSQHRYLAKYFISASSLQKIAYDFTHPQLVDFFPSGTSGDFTSAPTVAEINQAVKVSTLHIDGFTAHEIVISHPSWVQLQTTLGGPDGRGLTLREAMIKYHAVAGINASGFNDPGGDGNGGQPIGLIIIRGRLVNPSSALVGTNQVMGMTQGGLWFMGDYSASYMLSHHVQYAIQFGPELIANGNILVSGTDGWGYAPRTIVGQKANGSIVFWVNDGRWGSGIWDMGASLSQVAQILRNQGVVNAFNLDGGGSATMMLHKPDQPLTLVNQPDTDNPPYGMRFLPDAFLVIPPGYSGN